MPTYTDPYSGRPQFQLRFVISESSVSTSNNRSTLTWTLKARCVESGYEPYNLSGGPYVVRINGVDVKTGTKALDFRGHDDVGYEIDIASGTTNVTHDADGTKTVTVSARHDAGSPFNEAYTGSKSIALTDINRVPTAPTIGSVYLLTSDEARFNYTYGTANGGNEITTNDVQVGTTSGGSNIFNGTDSVSPKVLTGLSRYTTYYIRMRSVSETGVTSVWSAVKSFKTLAEVPVMATSYTAGSITRNSAIISGFSVSDNGGQAPSDVRVEYNTSASSSGSSVTTRGAWANVTLTGLTAATQYYYRAAPYNSGGWGDYPSTWKSFTTLADAPDDMASPTFSSVTDTSFRATWVAPSMNGATFIAYSYQVSTTDTFASLVTSGSTSALYVDVAGLLPGTTYYVRVRANATPNNGGYGVGSQLTTGFAPNSGMRTYMCIDGTIYQGTLYTFVDGVRKQLRPMYATGGTVETE